MKNILYTLFFIWWTMGTGFAFFKGIDENNFKLISLSIVMFSIFVVIVVYLVNIN